MRSKYIALCIAISCMAGCMERQTSNPVEAFKLWSGENPWQGIKVIHGRYWQSSHFTKEYILYLEMIVSPAWIKQFVLQNHLTENKLNVSIPVDAPVWVKPSATSQVWVLPELSRGSTYFFDPATSRFFLY